MKIELKKIKIKDLVKGYTNNNEDGVFGYGKKLNIRPPFQREFIYPLKEQEEVIKTIKNNFPLNVMYYSKSLNGNFELMDGQQRTMSICEYVIGNFSVNFQFFHNLTKVEQLQILNYDLMVYFCEGTEREKLDWFKIINIAGKPLFEQELRNAMYTGTWLTDAKRYFSKTGCPSYKIANEYMEGSPIRQDYLERVLEWKSKNKIDDYMSKHQHDKNANDLWEYFQNVIHWVKTIFTEYRKEMSKVNWGLLYNDYKNNKFNPEDMEKNTKKLMIDEDVTNKSGIYSYLITGDTKNLNIRKFTEQQKRKAFEIQNGNCKKCKKKFTYEEMEGDHFIPWSKGGKTEQKNLHMLCKNCNRKKSNI